MTDFDLEISREESLVATLELSHYTDSNTLFYRWPAENGETGVISLRRENSPIQVGQKLPEVQINSLDGNSVLTVSTRSWPLLADSKFVGL